MANHIFFPQTCAKEFPIQKSRKYVVKHGYLERLKQENYALYIRMTMEF